MKTSAKIRYRREEKRRMIQDWVGILLTLVWSNTSQVGKNRVMLPAVEIEVKQKKKKRIEQ